MIGRLQRYAMDYVHSRDRFVLEPALPSGKKVAVVGAGPAGLSCAGELALRGHSVTLFEKREWGGGLSTYGIIALREPTEIALAEVAMIERLGVTMRTGVEIGAGISVAELQKEFEVVFLSSGLGTTPELGIPGEEYILDGLQYVEKSKTDIDRLTIGRSVAVIGAGNTAIDCATIAKRMGAQQVTIVYRRTQREMTAYLHEYEFAKNEGIEFRFLAQPVRVLNDGQNVTGMECVSISLNGTNAGIDESGRPVPRALPGSEFVIAADQIVKAIGQLKPPLAQLFGLKTERGYICVNEKLETSSPSVFAGGDCIRAKGNATTVMAVQDGKMAAQHIHQKLTAMAPAGKVI
jgi:glutamate synthase (NADPH/NADH) small chain